MPEKVHVKGVDSLDTFKVKQFATMYFSADDFVRVEWIDDSKVNLIYATPEAALQALNAFTDSEKVDVSTFHPLKNRPAKKFSTAEKPDEPIYLEVRQATTEDVKQRGARDFSRFYLMNPDKDPRERKFKERKQRPRRASDENGEYTRRRFDDREHKRRRQDDALDASMYDDDPAVNSAEGSEQDRRKRVRFGQRSGEDLFSGRSAGRLRDRSASPLRDGDGRYGFGSDPDDSAVRRKIRQRSLTPPRLRNSQPGNIHSVNNSGKELFARPHRSGALAPSPAFTKELFPGRAGQSRAPLPRELFPGRAAQPRASPPKELFPNKKAGHRRSGAIDESPDRYVNTRDTTRPRSLADRISGGSMYGRLLSDSGADTEDLNIRGAAPLNIRGAAPISIRGAAPISIKGAGQQRGEFSIRGAAQNSAQDDPTPPVKELFPIRAGGNVGKELFAEKLKGRGGPRRAADSFF